MANIDKTAKISSRSEDIKMSDIRYISLKSKYTNFRQLRLGIHFISSGFKSIEFYNNKRGQVSELIDKENTIAYILDILIR